MFKSRFISPAFRSVIQNIIILNAKFTIFNANFIIVNAKIPGVKDVGGENFGEETRAPQAMDDHAAVSRSMRKFVSKTSNVGLKTRTFVFQTMNFVAGLRTLASCLRLMHGRLCGLSGSSCVCQRLKC